MKIEVILLFYLLALLYCTAFTSATTEKKKENQDSAKISTSLVISGDETNSTQTVIISRISDDDTTFLDDTSTITNVTRENSTRDLNFDITDDESTIENEGLPEILPDALELRHARPTRGRRPYYRPRRPLPPPTVNRRNVYRNDSPLRPITRPTRKQIDGKHEPTEKDCNFFSKTVCLKTLNYPQEAIIRSIRSNKNMVTALLKDYNFQSDDKIDNNPTNDISIESRYENNEIKRLDYPSPYDNVEEGFTCPSQVMYARPQLARAASGVWKYIINTGEHTQTLRLEKCSKPKGSCSFISDNYRSSCVQVYNYHRLLTWDNNLGLHMDIFKIPSCCSCHIHGYTDLYPPNQKDPKTVEDENYPGAEFSTEQDNDQSHERPSSYLTKQKPSSTYFDVSKPILDASSSNRPSFVLPVRPRPKKPTSSTSIPRPFNKLPQQHAPNTRAPGYKGLIIKGSGRPSRPNRPFRRESNSKLEDNTSVSNLNNWFNQPIDEDSETSSTRLHSGDFDEDYQEPNRRINYNYHPIIDFFKPEASMLQASESTQSLTVHSESTNSWKPMISS